MLNDLNPDLGLVNNHLKVPLFFEEIALLFTDAKIASTIEVHSWKSLNNKRIYLSLMNELPPPKVELESGTSLTEVWKLITFPCLDLNEREVLFLLVHRKLPVPERLFRVGLLNDPYCLTCLDSNVTAICDLEHLFCTCVRVKECWTSIRNIVLGLLPNATSGLSQNLDLISLNFSRNSYEKEIVWLIASYISEIWKTFEKQSDQTVNKENLFGFLKYKYKKNQMGSRLQLQEIPDLL